MEISLGGFPCYLQLFMVGVTYCWNLFLPGVIIEDEPQSYSFVPCSVQGLLITVCSLYTADMPGLALDSYWRSLDIVLMLSLAVELLLKASILLYPLHFS